MAVDYEAVKNVLSWVSARLGEKSTYVGLGMLFGAVGLHLSGVTTDNISQWGMVLGGLLSVLVTDRKS